MIRNGIFAKVFHVLFLVFMLAPLVVVVLVSFNPGPLMQLPSGGLSLRWYEAAISDKSFVAAFWLSIRLGVTSATVSAIISLPVALAITRYSFFGRDRFLDVMMSPLIVPSIVFGVAFLRFSSSMGFSSTFFGLLMGHVIVITPFMLRMLLSSLSSMGQDSEWAAASLGAGRFTIVRRIVVPLILPGLVGGWILAFIHSLDEIPVSIFVASPRDPTLPVKLFYSMLLSGDPVVSSVSTIVICLTAVALIILEVAYGLDRLLVGSRQK